MEGRFASLFTVSQSNTIAQLTDINFRNLGTNKVGITFVTQDKIVL